MQGAEPEETQNISALHQGLIDQIKEQGHLSSPEVETAFRTVPRHIFLPDLPPAEVYLDKAIPTKKIEEHFISSSSQPTMMALMLEQLQLQPGQRVLEIGAGTGYNAALMAYLVGEQGHVVTIDIDDDIVEAALRHLESAGFTRVQVIRGDGAQGYAADELYDRIILTVNANDIVPAWREQLKPGGILVLPLGLRGLQVSLAFQDRGDYLESLSAQPCGFVNIRGDSAETDTKVWLPPEMGRGILHMGEKQAISAQQVGQLLQKPKSDLTLPVQLTTTELYEGLGYWLAIHEAAFCELTVWGERALALDLIPGLPVPSTDTSTRYTFGLLNKHGLSVLMRAPHKQTDGSEPLHLGLRSFGQHTDVEQHLWELVTAWQVAGRPTARSLHVLAYPHLADRSIVGSQIVPKQWMDFACSWSE